MPTARVVVEDKVEAVRLYTLAANQSHANPQCTLVRDQHLEYDWTSHVACVLCITTFQL